MRIITHSERFHADEVFASALLKYLFDISEIIRTRDKDIISEAQEDINTFVVDVGGKYEINKNNFDHHQSDFNDVFGEKSWIKMSSCGLIWKHFGERIIEKFVKEQFDMELSPEEITSFFHKLYHNLFLSIDANDNGVKQIKNINQVKYNYFSNYSIPDIIAMYNRNIRDDNIQIIQFHDALDNAFKIFSNKIYCLILDKLEYNKNLVNFLEAFEKFNGKEYLYVDDDEIMVEKYVLEYDKEQRIKFVISKRYDDHYRIYTRRKYFNGFDIIKPLISQENAKELVGEDLIFIHKAGFVGASKTYKSAYKIVKESLKQNI